LRRESASVRFNRDVEDRTESHSKQISQNVFGDGRYNSIPKPVPDLKTDKEPIVFLGNIPAEEGRFTVMIGVPIVVMKDKMKSISMNSWYLRRGPWPDSASNRR
jgi:hypothetical protein